MCGVNENGHARHAGSPCLNHGLWFLCCSMFHFFPPISRPMVYPYIPFISINRIVCHDLTDEKYLKYNPILWIFTMDGHGMLCIVVVL